MYFLSLVNNLEIFYWWKSNRKVELVLISYEFFYPILTAGVVVHAWDVSLVDMTLN